MRAWQNKSEREREMRGSQREEREIERKREGRRERKKACGSGSVGKGLAIQRGGH